MTVVVDTSVLVDHLRGDMAARTALTSLMETGERVVGSVLTRTEILAGLRSAEAERTWTLIGVLDWIPVDADVADAAGDLAARFLRSHPVVDTVDYVIAATVARLGARLWTRNVKHFPMFPGLAVPY